MARINREAGSGGRNEFTLLRNARARARARESVRSLRLADSVGVRGGVYRHSCTARRVP